MSKTKNHRKLRKRKGGELVAVPGAPLTGTAPAGLVAEQSTVKSPATATGLEQPAATGTETAQTSEPSTMLSPPKFDPITPRPPGPGLVQATGQAPVLPPTPSIFGKLWSTVTSPFKKKEESSSEATSTSTSPGWFSSEFKWFAGKSRKHGKNKKSNKKSRKSRKSNKH